MNWICMADRMDLPGAPSTWPAHACDLAGLLDIAKRKQFEKTGTPCITVAADGLHDVSCIGGNAVLLEPRAHETNNEPMICTKRNCFPLGQQNCNIFVPVIGIDEVAFGVRRDGKVRVGRIGHAVRFYYPHQALPSDVHRPGREFLKSRYLRLPVDDGQWRAGETHGQAAAKAT